MANKETKNLKIAVSTTSIPLHTKILWNNLRSGGYDADLIQGDIQRVDWSKFDVLWSVGTFLSANFDVMYEFVKKKNPRIRIISHWCGTDLVQFSQFTQARPKCQKCVLENIDLHVCDSHLFVKELYQLAGVESEYVTLIPEQQLELKPLPPKEEFSVACYVPSERLEFYRFATLIDIARQFPDTTFNFFRTVGQSPLPNCHFLGWVEGEKKLSLYERCNACISIPIHGSLGVWVIELLQMGRRAILSEPYLHCLQAQKPDDIIRFLTELKDKVSPDEEASKFYREEYSLKHQLELVENALKKLE